MKIRSCFVSNSSSSSFCIMGTIVDVDELSPELQQLCEYDLSELIYVWNDEHPNNQVKLITIERGISKYYDKYVIGGYVSAIKDDQTILDFKKQILNEINTVGFKNINLQDLQWCVDGGIDN